MALAPAPALAAGQGLNMYRLYNPNSGEHFYTSNLGEARNVFGAGWRWEGVGWVAPSSGDNVYRLYNRFAGDHHYTLSTHERDVLVSKGWTYEGVGWKSGGGVSVLRQYNPNAVAGTHNFTTSTGEDSALGAAGWRREGKAWQALSTRALAIQGFWAVSSGWGSLERYWVASDAQIARDRIVSTSEGAGYTALALGDGRILRGAMDAGDWRVWLADNDGRLATGSGWRVTGDYDGGRMRRYWLESRGAYAVARAGIFDVGGALYHADGDTGYVLCGCLHEHDGSWWTSDADGVMHWQCGISNEGSDLGRAVADACRRVDSPGYGWCAAWVTNVYGEAGAGYFGGNACDMYDNWCWSNNICDLRVGMLVSVRTHSRTEAGSKWGHVGIYVGNGQVMDNVGDIRTISMVDWFNYYQPAATSGDGVRWGYAGNAA